MRGGLFPRDGKYVGRFIPERWYSVRGGLFLGDSAVCGEVYSREMVSMWGGLFPRDGKCAGRFIPGR